MIRIDLAEFRSEGSRVFSGRGRGKSVRKKTNLDELDETEETITVVVPEDTYSINSSFFLELFGPSVSAAGSEEAFFQRFTFECTPEIHEDIEGSVADALKDQSALAEW